MITHSLGLTPLCEDTNAFLVIRVKISVSNVETFPWSLFVIPGDMTFDGIIRGISTGKFHPIK